MIVNGGMDDLAVNYIASNYTTVKIGNGGDSTAASQSALDAVVAEKVITPSVIGSQLIWTAEFTGEQIGLQGVSELGIFKTTSDSTDDTMLSRVTFTNTGVVASADTVTFTIRPVTIYPLGIGGSLATPGPAALGGSPSATNYWHNACDNLTNQSIVCYGVRPSDTTGGGPGGVPYSQWSSPSMSSWLSASYPSAGNIEVLDIDQSGANNYNVDPVFASAYAGSLDKIDEIEF